MAGAAAAVHHVTTTKDVSKTVTPDPKGTAEQVEDAVKPIKSVDKIGSEKSVTSPVSSNSSRRRVQPAPTGCWRWQPKAEKIYTNMKVQLFVAALIAGNFLCNIIEKWIDPVGTEYPSLFYGFETFFNTMFFFELLVNMYAFWCCRFWKSGWNIFDFVVVAIGILSVLRVELPGPLSMLRMMRAFRVFRLFKRVKSLNKIMVSLAKAVPGVANAFFILLLVMSIYAIIAVDLFKDFGKGFKFTNIKGKEVELITSRKQEYGFEYFGNFGKSLYTMFQVLTCESWSEAIARPLLHCNSVAEAFGVAFFFVSFIIVNAIVLINVVVAVLLEKMVDDTEKKADTQEEEPMEDDEVERLGTQELEDIAGFAAAQPMWQQPNSVQELPVRKSETGGAVSGAARGSKDGLSASVRVANLRADLDAMKEDMAVIQESLTVVLSLLSVKSEGPKNGEKSTGNSPMTEPLPDDERGPRHTAFFDSDRGRTQPSTFLPGSMR
ncbi:unnamed protein product [Durusdinium trenchii]|uniref:Ion transport domain-containing protein n=2 Tax=Durusdinium trenchii TaxID=1381693 RepID=A0ABP0SXC1_9DINO